MTRDEILTKAAEAMQNVHSPTQPRDPRWRDRSIAMYRARFTTGLDAVEDDIRRDERNRITAWLREVGARPGMGARSARDALPAVAAELDRRPIEEPR